MRRTFDTNICSYILRRHPPEMIERFANLDRQDLWLSSIVAAELRFGAAKLGQPRFQSAVETWLSGFDLRPWPLEATHHYASVRTALERAGRPIGGMDLMIAAHALAEDSVLITNNAREFHRVPGLAVEEWAELQVQGPAVPDTEGSGFGLLKSARPAVPADLDPATLLKP